jgi:hypothetical protein
MAVVLRHAHRLKDLATRKAAIASKEAPVTHSSAVASASAPRSPRLGLLATRAKLEQNARDCRRCGRECVAPGSRTVCASGSTGPGGNAPGGGNNPKAICAHAADCRIAVRVARGCRLIERNEQSAFWSACRRSISHGSTARLSAGCRPDRCGSGSESTRHRVAGHAPVADHPPARRRARQRVEVPEDGRARHAAGAVSGNAGNFLDRPISGSSLFLGQLSLNRLCVYIGLLGVREFECGGLFAELLGIQ